MKYFLLFSILFFNFLFADTSSKDVLLLHSYHKGYIWSDDISKTIEKNFIDHKNIQLTTVYMDTKRIDNSSYLSDLSKLYKQQFEGRKFDLIIVSDNTAFDFTIKYHDYLFEDVPVLFCGINNFSASLLGENNMKNFMSGVAEDVDLEKNFELILKLHPKIKNLLIINDTSTTGYAIKRDLRPIIEKYKEKFNIEYTDNLEINNLKKKVSSLDKSNSIILFVLLFKDTTDRKSVV